MDILKYKLLNTNEGTSSVACGINRTQIVKVCRQGLQQDYVSPLFLSASARSWSYFGVNKRILVNTDFPFAAGEQIFVIYKLST